MFECITALKIGAPSTANKQRVTCKNTVIHLEAVRIVGVPWCVNHIEADPFYGNLVAFFYSHGHYIHSTLLTHDGNAFSLVTKDTHAREMVGVDVRIDDLYKIEVEFLEEKEILLHSVQYWINDKRFTARSASQ